MNVLLFTSDFLPQPLSMLNKAFLRGVGWTPPFSYLPTDP